MKEEYKCDSCIHKEICRKKEEYDEVIKAIKDKYIIYDGCFNITVNCKIYYPEKKKGEIYGGSKHN